MYILAVDDEQNILDELLTEIQKVFPPAQLHGERCGAAAREWAEQLAKKGQRLEYAFLDVRMGEMNGLELARHLKTLHPDVRLIFCTAYTQYAFDAMSLFAKGYLMKPVSAQDIRKTLDEMVYDWRSQVQEKKRDIRVQTFGHFEVFVDDKPVVFEREKAKELLAYLVDRRGKPVTTRQIASVLWEDKPYDRTLKNYVTTLVRVLRKALRAVGAEDMIIKRYNSISLDINKFRCDSYDYENWDAVAVNSFRGEYMVNYSWAEFTAGRYTNMDLDRDK